MAVSAAPGPNAGGPPIITGRRQRGQRVLVSGALLFGGLVAVALFSRALSFNFVLFGLGGLLLVGWLWINANMRGLHIRRRYDRRAFFGQTVRVQLELHNRGLWPLLWLSLHESLPTELAAPNFFRGLASLGPRERVRMDYTLVGLKRGYFRIGDLTLETGDFWGIFDNAACYPAEEIIVYPRIVRLARIPVFAASPFGELRGPQRLNEDPSRFFGLRPYTSGDSLRQIDWKATASTGTLHVRRFQSSIALDAHIVLDLNQAAYPVSAWHTASEFGITLAASLAAFLTQQRQPHGLSVIGHDPHNPEAASHYLPIRKGNAALMQSLALLARIQSKPGNLHLRELLSGTSIRLPWGTLVFVITPNVSDDDLAQLHSLRQRGLRPVLLLTAPDQQFRALRARAEHLGVACFRAASDRDLAPWQNTR